jgi:hypothetical protein
MIIGDDALSVTCVSFNKVGESRGYHVTSNRISLHIYCISLEGHEIVRISSRAVLYKPRVMQTHKLGQLQPDSTGHGSADKSGPTEGFTLRGGYMG